MKKMKYEDVKPLRGKIMPQKTMMSANYKNHQNISHKIIARIDLLC